MPKKGLGVQKIRRIARERFGFARFRPGQEESIKAILAGQDTLAVMPTGSGKSAIYQIAALLVPGPTVIVSPLIALQRDQVEAIEEQQVASADLVNSTVSKGEREEAFEELKGRALEFLFLAPEQFGNEETLAHLREAKPSLFVVDEAHCISEWGHDFRPDYLKLGNVIEALDHPTVLALTATAAPPVRDEIITRLKMHDPIVVVKGFDRPNIWLGAETFAEEATKRDALLDTVGDAHKPGLVYVATRKRAEEIAAALGERGVKASFYHAGMSAGDRERAQAAFMEDEVEVMVATVAFGMGIDKPNVRFVFHYDISESLDGYYHEIGRAGRDDRPARAMLFYRPEDVGLRRFFAGPGEINAGEVEQVVEAVQNHEGPLDVEDLERKTDLSESKVTRVVNRLEEVGAVETLPTGDVRANEQHSDPDEAAEEAVEAQELRRRFEQSRVEMMRGYAETKDCRREYMLSYFGETMEGPCGYCDNCEAGVSLEDVNGSVPFPLQSKVKHKTWGEGQVLRYSSGKIVVLFDQVGYKTLALEVTKRRQLLEPVS